MRERADGDEIGSGLRVGGQIFERYAAGKLHAASGALAADDRDHARGLGGGKIIEQDLVPAGRGGLGPLGFVAPLRFNGQTPRRRGVGGAARGPGGAAGDGAPAVRAAPRAEHCPRPRAPARLQEPAPGHPPRRRQDHQQEEDHDEDEENCASQTG